MTDEEIISLNRMKLFARSSDLSIVTAKDMNIVVTLVEKQSKEIEELHKEINQRIKLKLENERCADEDFIHKDKIKAKIKWYEDFRGSILYEKYNYEEFVKDLQSLLEKE